MRWQDRVLTVMVMLFMTAVTLLLCVYNANAEEVWTVEPMIEYQHTSDIWTGCPLRCDVPESSPEFDKLSVGGTLYSPNRRWEIDITLGKKAFSCSLRDSCKSENETTARVRWYPWRRK